MVVYSYDLAFSKNGDYVLEDGDLKDTTWDPYESLRQEIRTRVTGALNDWKLYPFITANLEDYIGQPNNRELGSKIELRVRASLTHDLFLNGSDIKVKAFPLSQEAIAVSVDVAAQNYMKPSEAVAIRSLFTLGQHEVNPNILAMN